MLTDDVEESDFTRIQRVIRRHDLQFVPLHPLLEQRFGLAELPGYTACVCDDAIVNFISRIIRRLGYRRLNRRD